MEKVFITGATGFIGNALTRFCLAQGSETHVLVRSPESKQLFPPGITVHVTDGSLDSLRLALESTRPDTVFHIASLFLANHQPAQVGPLVASNVLFGTQLLEAMVQTGCTKLINTGTSWQHFATPDYRPVNLYAATKQAFEDIISYYHQVFGLSCITLKLFDTFGPGDTRRKLVNILTEAAQTGAVLSMSQGEQIIDISYIDDIVTAYAQAARLLETASEPVLCDYFVSGERISLRKLVEVVGSTLGRKINVQFGDRPYREREVMLPVMPGERLLPGWQPRYGLSDGIRLLAGASTAGNR
jgi:nucleoside-diphosphate-sugar epimerase